MRQQVFRRMAGNDELRRKLFVPSGERETGAELASDDEKGPDSPPDFADDACAREGRQIRFETVSTGDERDSSL